MICNVHKPKKRELFAWGVICLQSLAFWAMIQGDFSFSRQRFLLGNNAPDTDDTEYQSMLKMNNKISNYYTKRQSDSFDSPQSLYEHPLVHPKEAGLVSRVWRSNGSPAINPDLQRGTCWCSADEWCMCTPSLAIDVILTSGPDHVWLVRREDTGKLALMGGFTEVGETSEESVARELKEEMDISLTTKPILFGVYNDPLRDARRHTTSVVYIVDVPEGVVPKAGDDAKAVVRLPLDGVDTRDFFIDHKTILKDYLVMRKREAAISDGQPVPDEPVTGDGEPFKRSVCPM